MKPGTTLQAARRISVFDLSQPGLGGNGIIDSDFDGEELPSELAEIATRKSIGLPELSEVDVVRHFTRLSQWNFSIDTNFYPLGSCTMKYNPRCLNTLASLPGFLNCHPLDLEKNNQGFLEILFELLRE